VIAMDLIGYLLIGVLLCQSTLALAMLFEAIQKAGFRRGQMLRSLSSMHAMAREWHSLSSAEQDRRRRSLQADPLAVAVDLLTRDPGKADVAEMHLHRWLQSLDGNTGHLRQWLVKTAPLIGLAGTLAGISCSMAQFQQRVSDPGVIVHGFAVAIETTLYGIFVSCFCLIADRLFWKPLKDEMRERWLDIETQLVLTAKKSAEVPAGQKVVAQRPAEPGAAKAGNAKQGRRGDKHQRQVETARSGSGRLDANIDLPLVNGNDLPTVSRSEAYCFDMGSPPVLRTQPEPDSASLVYSH